jgi:hypothetical protein
MGGFDFGCPKLVLVIVSSIMNILSIAYPSGSPISPSPSM